MCPMGPPLRLRAAGADQVGQWTSSLLHAIELADGADASVAVDEIVDGADDTDDSDDEAAREDSEGDEATNVVDSGGGTGGNPRAEASDEEVAPFESGDGQ